MARPKILAVFDFDFTLIDCNLDTKIKSLSGSKEIPQNIEKLSKDSNRWTAYMGEIFKYLFKNQNLMNCLQIQKFQEKNDCSRCPDNLCKGFILKNYIAERLAEGQYFYRILYIGDGSNDVCPALKLTANDYVFARVGFRLLRSLEKMPAKDVKPNIIPWENGHDIRKALMS